MKNKNIILIIIISITTLFLNNKSYSQESDIKKFYIKVGYSLNKSFNPDENTFLFIIQLDNSYALYFNRQNEWKSNFRLELNYKIQNDWKVGLYVGIIDYPLFYVVDTVSSNIIESHKKAPSFGIQFEYQIHNLFPHFPKQLELYVTGKYGGVYLSEWGGTYIYPTRDLFCHPIKSKYRHEYGFGIGVQYYFTPKLGLYTDFMFGQYSYFPDLLTSATSIRSGLVLKL